MNKHQLFDQNHGLSPLEKSHLCVFCKEKGLFCKKNDTKYLFWVHFAKNETLTKFKIFHLNNGLTPWQKCQFCGFLKQMFSLSRKACLLYKISKIVFSRFIFTIYYTGGGMGLQGMTGGYKGLQGERWGSKGLNGVTGGYKGFWELFLTITFSNTFSWCILLENQS